MMPILKVYCSNCGQRVSGDESFYGTTATCPICASEIRFPEAPGTDAAAEPLRRVPPPPVSPASSPPAAGPLPLPRAFEAAPAAPLPAQAMPLPAQALPLPVGPVLPAGPVPGPVPSPSPEPGLPRTQPEEPDSMPAIVLGIGIAAMVPCLGILCAPVAIILGHIALMRLDANDLPRKRNRIILGTTLGYVSLVLLLLTAIAWKFVGPTILETIRPATE